MLKIITLLFAATVNIGCSASYKYVASNVAGGHLTTSTGVLISTPEDARFENATYNNSGAMTANAVQSAFARHADRVDTVSDCHGINCLDDIDLVEFGYYVKPEILHWEDRATEWSGKSDRLEIHLTVYDTSTRQKLASGSYSGKSKWATMGGDHPQDLLAKPTDHFVSMLYGGSDD